MYSARILLLATIGASGILGATSRSVHAQAVSVSGNVSDESGNAISQAHVELADQARTATTDSLGAFTIGNVMPGRHRLLVRQVGFQPADTVIDATVSPASVNIRLRRNVQDLARVVVRGKRQGVFGAVATAKTLQPLPNTSLRVIGGTSITTDSIGQFALGLTQPGGYVLRFEREGYAPRSLSIEVGRDEAKEVLITMEESARSDAHLQRLWREFSTRTSMAGLNAAMVPGHELGSNGRARLSDALMRSRSFTIKNLRMHPDVCVFVNGEPKPGWSADALAVEDILAVEVYGRHGDRTNLRMHRWPRQFPCGAGSGSVARRRSKSGFGPIPLAMESSERRVEAETIVVWLKDK